MVKKYLKKGTSFAAALAVVLSLSCCGVGDEILIDEIPTETTSEAAEITSEMTEEATTEEVTETTSEETEEVTSVETTLTIPDEETILASLSDEEKKVWLSMPDIVTMRMLKRRDENDNFLYTEIVYIDKIGQIKKFISPDEPKQNGTEHVIKWLNEQISQDKNAELVNIVGTDKLIKFFKTLMLINGDSELSLRYTTTLNEYIERHYWFELYGIRNNSDNSSETLLLSKGDAGFYSVRHNSEGREAFDLYLQLEPFMIDVPGGLGHLTGEEG